jgi:outer membrane lipoprotein-sorting protein
MKRETALRAYLLVLPFLGALLSGCARPSPVDEIVASNLAARGGKARLQGLRSLRETGTVKASGGRIARVVREMKRPGLLRLEFSTEGTTSVFAHDGKTGWQIAPLQGEFEPRAMPPEAEATAGVDQRDIEGPLLNWREKGHVVELVGSEALPGGEAFQLKVTLAGGAVRYDWVDAATHQIVRSRVTRTIRGRTVELDNLFSEFRTVGGLVFPHHIETRAKDRPEVLTITVEKIELDPSLDDARFRMPE